MKDEALEKQADEGEVEGEEEPEEIGISYLLREDLDKERDERNENEIVMEASAVANQQPSALQARSFRGLACPPRQAIACCASSTPRRASVR